MSDLAMPTPQRSTQPVASRFSRIITLELVLWAVLILIAVWTRFWDLGYRAQHHDESLHSYYSWLFATGDRLYQHHPLMHGPFLFHANALIYKLFGADDTTSRIVPALFGVAIVWMPWLLRAPRFLGHWGALAAGFMLLISPSMLYYTRYIRHDPYMVAGCLLLAIAIFRYLEVPQRRWIIIAFASVGFLLTNHELVLATFAIMVAMLWGSLLMTHLRPLIAIHIAALAMLAFAAWRWMDHPWPPIPWQRPAQSALQIDEFMLFLRVCGPVVVAFIAIVVMIGWVRNIPVAAGAAVALVVAAAGWVWLARDWIPVVPDWSDVLGDANNSFLTTSQFYWALLQHPFVQGVLIISAIFAIGCVVTIRWMLGTMSDDDNGIDYILGDAEANTVAYGLRHALHDGTGLYIGVFTAIGIWVVLFTSFFTNPNGIGSGTYETNGTLLYWLGQHDVQRGSQPWFYFIILALQYEWLSFLLAFAGSVLVAWRLLRWIAGGKHGPNFFWYVFIVGWFVGMFAVLSWAGEKMPWLIMHIVLPATLVAAWIVNSVVEGAIDWYRQRDVNFGPIARYGGIVLVAALLIAATSWFYIGAHLTYGDWIQLDTGAWQRTVTDSALDAWWMLALPPLVALFLIAAAIWMIGPRRAIYSTLVAMFAILSLFQIHSGFRMAYVDGDLAVDTLIYNTISADMTQFTTDMSTLSTNVYGDNSISIAYDQCKMQWPTNWYLKSDEFPNANFTSYAAMGSPDVILVAHDSQGCGWPERIPGYTRQIYSLRVHESESATYRNFAIAPEIPPGRSAWQSAQDPHDLGAVINSVGSSLTYATTPEGQQRLFRLVMFRDPAGEQTVYPMSVWIRDDLLPQYNDIRYGENHP